MKNIFSLLIVCTFISCKENLTNKTKAQQSFNLTGTINGAYSDYIYLNYGNVKDSVKVLNNSFKFNGKVEKPTQGWLNLKPDPDANVAWLYIENSDIIIQADYDKKRHNGKTLNFLEINNVKGSYSAKIQNEYKEFYQANKNKENFKALLYEKLKSFIKINKNHPFSGTILSEIALINPVLTKKELLQLYSKIDTTQQNKSDLEMFKMGIANLDKYGIKKPFLEFSLPNAKNENVDIKSFSGKITLVDFWASWCVPCRIKHPELIKLKEKFLDTNFDIVSVSIDDNKKSWIEAVEKDNLTWTNLIDIDKKVNDELKIQSIPFNYLIDENGIVLGVNLSSIEIERIVSEKASR
ncbi:TlpA disulfide reductase family protein [Tenacibaculum tangerinum]|uniref:TlpA disulfide reductase family protein n=1 Tax=Tenacibaculum tangerinum TaxID=3038772 RepID=A0ABY8L3F9_9FLAO|nr:TlpA disulfide reductase family protein [Tenacibaculum tangerinum]WGH75972.1 TlpA disulfide reductase family protein [Tenacibaculum tangerinum]